MKELRCWEASHRRFCSSKCIIAGQPKLMTLSLLLCSDPPLSSPSSSPPVSAVSCALACSSQPRLKLRRDSYLCSKGTPVSKDIPGTFVYLLPRSESSCQLPVPQDCSASASVPGRLARLSMTLIPDSSPARMHGPRYLVTRSRTAWVPKVLSLATEAQASRLPTILCLSVWSRRPGCRSPCTAVKQT